MSDWQTGQGRHVRPHREPRTGQLHHEPKRRRTVHRTVPQIDLPLQ